MKYTSILIFVFICVNCSPNTEIEEYKKLAIQYRDEKDLGKAIIELRNIVKKYPDKEEAAEAQFKIGEIYLNDVKDYQFAVDEFQKVIDLFPNMKVTPKAAFMIGYIYANNLEAYSYALNHYRDFLTNYPNHELTPSVEFELNGLLKFETVIDSLNDIAIKKKEIL